MDPTQSRPSALTPAFSSQRPAASASPAAPHQPPPISGEDVEDVLDLVQQTTRTSLDEVDDLLRRLFRLREKLSVEGERVNEELRRFHVMHAHAHRIVEEMTSSARSATEPQLPLR